MEPRPYLGLQNDLETVESKLAIYEELGCLTSITTKKIVLLNMPASNIFPMQYWNI